MKRISKKQAKEWWDKFDMDKFFREADEIGKIKSQQ